MPHVPTGLLVAATLLPIVEVPHSSIVPRWEGGGGGNRLTRGLSALPANQPRSHNIRIPPLYRLGKCLARVGHNGSLRPQGEALERACQGEAVERPYMNSN